MEEYISKAPAEMRDVLTNGVAVHNQAKDALVAKILANDNCTFGKEWLNAKGLQELQGLAALATPAASATTHPDIIPMFNGAATPGGPLMNDGEVTEGHLLAPIMNFEEAANGN